VSQVWNSGMIEPPAIQMPPLEEEVREHLMELLKLLKREQGTEAVVDALEPTKKIIDALRRSEADRIIAAGRVGVLQQGASGDPMAAWAGENVRELVGMMMKYVMGMYQVGEECVNVRMGDLMDFDEAGCGSVIDRNFSQFDPLGLSTRNRFTIRQIAKHYAVGVVGFMVGNLNDDRKGAMSLLGVRVDIGTKTMRRYPGAFFPTQMNGKALFPDAVFAERGKRLEIVLETNNAPVDCTAMPIIIVAEPSSC